MRKEDDGEKQDNGYKNQIITKIVVINAMPTACAKIRRRTSLKIWIWTAMLISNLAKHIKVFDVVEDDPRNLPLKFVQHRVVIVVQLGVDFKLKTKKGLDTTPPPAHPPTTTNF